MVLLVMFTWRTTAAVLLFVANYCLPYACSAQEIDWNDHVTYLTSEDFQNGMLLGPGNFPISAELYGSGGKPLWAQEKYQGDIAGKAALRRRLKVRGVARNGVRMTKDKWPNNEIPYVLGEFYSPKERAVIARSMQAYHDRTCEELMGESRVVLRTVACLWPTFTSCFSDVGRGGGRQDLSLDYGCLDYDTIIHELMHAVGFWHEHERWDRDEYINILWENIAKELCISAFTSSVVDAYDQFGKANLLESDFYGERYDYFSIMHYDSKAFTRNGRRTIEAVQPGMTDIIGQMKDFSAVDLRKINKMYNCPPYYQYMIGNTGGGWLNRLPTTVTGEPTVSTLRSGPSILPSAPLFPPRVCEDKATQCWLILNRCRSLFYEFLMRYLCPKSCGFCS
ncbi:shTK domain protein [Trichuris suis]|nr:shTK domain protein [Trichuris suis]